MAVSNKKNLRIAILTPTFFEYSGIDRLVEQEAINLERSGNKVSIFTFSATIKTPVNVFLLGMPNNQILERVYRLLFFLDIQKLMKYTKELKDYDIVISHFYPLTILAYFAKKFYKVKYIYHNAGVSYPFLFENILERIYLGVFRFLNNLTIKNADEIISISKFLSDELKKETGLNSRVEYPIIDKSRFKKELSGKNVRRRYNLGESPIILFVGRVSPHKGVHILIESFKLAKKKIGNLKLIIVGMLTFSGYYKRLMKIAEDFSNDIIFAGVVSDSDLPEYYSACNVYASASLWEGYNLPLAEAQACGKPVIAFNLCSHPEVVKNGILVKPREVREFADAIVRLMEKK